MDCLSNIHYVRPDRQLFPSKAYVSSKCLVRCHLNIIGTNECDNATWVQSFSFLGTLVASAALLRHDGEVTVEVLIWLRTHILTKEATDEGLQ